ncbi:MAG TPA: CHASE3 domain-containing protein [Steroidobacteraceae bacterium]|nr:CHASE3 domain-containing protein [Steroidobacteraceae bacterium]
MLGFNRRSVLVPILLSIVLLGGSFSIDNAAQSRLAQSTQRVQFLLQRQTLLSNLMQLLVDAENGQRGYLLTGEDSFLEPYREAVVQREPTFEALRRAYQQGNPQVLEQLATIDELMADRFGELAIAIKLQQTSSRDAAAEFIRTRVSTRTMVRIRDSVEELRRLEANAVPTMIGAQRSDLLLTRIITAAGLALNMFLVLLAGALISRNLSRRVADAQRLLLEKNELERLVAERTADLSALSSHLQQVTEQEKGDLARELHDELGGLLVAAKMDVTWLRRKVGTEDPDSRIRWERVLEVLDSGVDLKRRVVEQLRPTLLDNMGLYSALRWQLQESCGRVGLKCDDTMPELELPISSAASIAIFRIAQEAMTNIIKHAHATEAELSVVVTDEALIMTIRDNGVGVVRSGARAVGSHGLLSMRHRVQALGGSWSLSPGIGGKGTEVQVRLPLDRIQVTAD